MIRTVVLPIIKLERRQFMLKKKNLVTLESITVSKGHAGKSKTCLILISYAFHSLFFLLPLS